MKQCVNGKTKNEFEGKSTSIVPVFGDREWLRSLAKHELVEPNLTV